MNVDLLTEVPVEHVEGLINLGENLSEQGHMKGGLYANEQCLTSDH